MSKLPSLTLILIILVVGVLGIWVVRTVLGRTVIGVPTSQNNMSHNMNQTSESTTAATQPASVLDLQADDITGAPANLSQYKGKVVLIVNTASKCGFTPQYESLEKLYKQYEGKDFVVLGFPSNDFGGQDPGTNAEIASFCQKNYGVSFPMMSKIVVKGASKHPIYAFLTGKETNGEFAGEIGWNFTKFLVDKNGVVFARLSSNTKPTDPKVIQAIDDALSR